VLAALAVEAAIHDECYEPKKDKTRDCRSDHDSPTNHFAFEEFASNEGEKE
jgi:hypothetical protein